MAMSLNLGSIDVGPSLLRYCFTQDVKSTKATFSCVRSVSIMVSLLLNVTFSVDKVKFKRFACAADAIFYGNKIFWRIRCLNKSSTMSDSFAETKN